ncbi:hypothetical protein B9Z55_012054 [Caenorhabditis nigoni]|uniref:Uncharacterized protein n=1 Tax=Caenorhabditis nigoni TaxID=1611254 RepID=A0A2G5TVH4_9PELO|nr:hypothetical protein B9Z55_012054 [Caenorhabditis nigoni]
MTFADKRIPYKESSLPLKTPFPHEDLSTGIIVPIGITSLVFGCLLEFSDVFCNLPKSSGSFLALPGPQHQLARRLLERKSKPTA